MFLRPSIDHHCFIPCFPLPFLFFSVSFLVLPLPFMIISRGFFPNPYKFDLYSRKRHEEGQTGGNMKLQNLKLYLENRSILEENEKLRQKALHLMQENQALLSEFQRKFQFSLVQGTKNSIN